MDGLSTALVSGIGVGVAVAAPVGPMGLLCVQRTLSGGLGAGVMTGFAAALTQIVWGSLIVGAYATFAFGWVDGPGRILHAASAALLAWFALRILRRRRRRLVQAPGAAASLSRCFLSAAALGLSNPMTLALLAAAMPALAAPGQNLDAPQFLLGQFCGAFGWWLGVGVLVGGLRARLSEAILGRLDVASGVLLAGLAARSVARALGS